MSSLFDFLKQFRQSSEETNWIISIVLVYFFPFDKQVNIVCIEKG